MGREEETDKEMVGGGQKNGTACQWVGGSRGWRRRRRRVDCCPSRPPTAMSHFHKSSGEGGLDQGCACKLREGEGDKGGIFISPVKV